MAVQSPEAISGTWEAHENSGTIGLHIHLTTTVGGQPTGLRGVKQILLLADIEVYGRQGAQQKIGDGAWYQDDSPGVVWDGWHLRIVPMPASGTTNSLDLSLDDSGVWRGHYQRGAFSGVVSLTRPHPKNDQMLSPFVGTWRRQTLMNNCLHVTQAQGGEFIAWSDDLMAPGKLRWGNGLKPPAQTPEQFGSVAFVSARSRSISIEMKALSATCCSILSDGKLSPDARIIIVGQASKPSDANWTRMRGGSCIDDRHDIPAASRHVRK